MIIATYYYEANHHLTEIITIVITSFKDSRLRNYAILVLSSGGLDSYLLLTAAQMIITR
jgi:tRNA(Ile)-lysidine synthase TilS/MesJ